MPRKTAFKCYFGCIPYKGKVHSFPPHQYPHTEKFDQWKMVLRETDQERGDNYICKNIRICDNHFEDFYRSSTGYLTKNAVPTLNIASKSSSEAGLTSCYAEPNKTSINEGTTISRESTSTTVEFILPNTIPDSAEDIFNQASKSSSEMGLTSCYAEPNKISINEGATFSRESTSTSVEFILPNTISDSAEEIFKQASNSSSEMGLTSCHAEPNKISINEGATFSRESTSTTVEFILPNTISDSAEDILNQGSSSQAISPLSEHVPETISIRHTSVKKGTNSINVVPNKYYGTQLKVKLSKLRGKCKNLNQKVRIGAQISQNKAYLQAVERLHEPAATFTRTQLKKEYNKPRGRKFTNEEKVLCQKIYKHCQNTHKLLQRLFALRSKKDNSNN